MADPKYNDLVEAIAQAAWDSREHLRNHLRRDDEDAPEVPEGKTKSHGFIETFQEAVCTELNGNELLFGKPHPDPKKRVWQMEIEKKDTEEGDRVDIMKVKGRKCIIEIDATRHDQIAPKFVSRIALWGLLSDPIDYVILLYDSTRKEGKPNSEKFVRYTYALLKAINPKSTLIGIYVHTDKTDKTNDDLEYWDCENQKFTIDIKGDTSPEPCPDMNECARSAIKHYIENNKGITFDKLCEKFTISKRTGSSYISSNEGKSRANPIDDEIEGHQIYVYSQFRAKGNQSNWFKFVEICKDNGIVIEQIYKTDAYKKPHN